MTESILDGLSTEETLIIVMSNLTDAINKLTANQPRTDVNKRILTNGTETTQAVSGTVTVNGTVTANVPSINQFGSNVLGTNKGLDSAPTHFANAGAMHIYNNIQFN